MSTGSEESQAGQPNSHGSLTGQTGLVSMWSSWMAAEVESRLTMGKTNYGTVTTKSGAEIQEKQDYKNIDEWNEHISQILHHVSPIYIHDGGSKGHKLTLYYNLAKPYPHDSLFTW